MSLVIKSNHNIIGPIAVMRIAGSSYSNKLKWISKSKNSKNYGDSIFPSKIKTIFKKKAKL
jgi:hypothetical protein